MLEPELARAKRRAELEQKIERAAGDLANTGSAKLANSDAVALAAYLVRTRYRDQRRSRQQAAGPARRAGDRVWRRIGVGGRHGARGRYGEKCRGRGLREGFREGGFGRGCNSAREHPAIPVRKRQSAPFSETPKIGAQRASRNVGVGEGTSSHRARRARRSSWRHFGPRAATAEGASSSRHDPSSYIVDWVAHHPGRGRESLITSTFATRPSPLNRRNMQRGYSSVARCSGRGRHCSL